MKKWTQQIINIMLLIFFTLLCIWGYQLYKFYGNKNSVVISKVETCECNLKESRAIEGCELAAFQVHNSLQECEWKINRIIEKISNMTAEQCKELFPEGQ